MKQNIHPQNYREVAFRDVSSGQLFIIKSAVNTNETVTINGQEYPLFKVETSSASHPFYTGNSKAARSTGQVEKFNKRFKKSQ